MNPNATIVILSRNDRTEFLREQLRSCLLQTGVSIQVIVSTVVNDPSITLAKDMGAEVVVDESPGKASPKQMFRQWNLALSKVEGKWMAGCSGNDVTLPTKMVDGIQKCLRTDTKICDSAFYVADERLVVNDITDLSKFFPYKFSAHSSGISFVSDACVMHMDVMSAFLPFREDLGNFGLYDLWLRVGKVHPEWFVYNKTPEWIYRLSSNSRHIRKQHDPSLKQRDLRDKRAMLALHTG